MDHPALVESDVRAGEAIVRELDGAGFPVTAALWLMHPEAAAWRLMIATPLVDQAGPLQAYERLNKLLGEHHDAAYLGSISLVSPANPLVQVLSGTFTTGPGVHRARISRSTFNGVFIEDALIYRMQATGRLPVGPQPQQPAMNRHQRRALAKQDRGAR